MQSRSLNLHSWLAVSSNLQTARRTDSSKKPSLCLCSHPCLSFCYHHYQPTDIYCRTSLDVQPLLTCENLNPIFASEVSPSALCQVLCFPLFLNCSVHCCTESPSPPFQTAPIHSPHNPFFVHELSYKGVSAHSLTLSLCATTPCYLLVIVQPTCCLSFTCQENTTFGLLAQSSARKNH